MKLIYNHLGNKILIKEGNSKKELEKEKYEYIAKEREKYNNLIKRFSVLEESKKDVIRRENEDSEEEYYKKLIVSNKDFIEELENILKEANLDVVEIKYKDVPNDKITIKTKDDIFSFFELRNVLALKIPVIVQFKIVE